MAYPDLRSRILVPTVDEPLRSIIRRSLELLGLDGAFDHALEYPEWCEELMVVQGLTAHGMYMSPLVFRTLDRLAGAVPDEPVGERIYVERRAPFVRRLANGDAVIDRMRERGYVALRPEEMTLDQQIAAFRGARRVFGVAGAGLASIAFCRPGTEVTILYPQNMPDTFYWFLAQHRGLTFNDIRCLPAGATRSHLEWDYDVVLEPRMLTWYVQ